MMSNYLKGFIAIATILVGQLAFADVDVADVFCTIREGTANLNCQWVGKDNRKSMGADDIVQFIDRAEVVAYVNVRSRKGFERTFLVDAESPQFRKLSELKKSGSISEISRAKNDLFAEIEKKLVKVSDDLDAQLATMELVKYDNYIAVEKYKRELHRIDQANAAYEQGPNAVAGASSSGTSLSTNKYEIYLGGGTASTSINLLSNTVNTSKSTSPSAASVVMRYNWNDRWMNELEYRSTMSSDYDAISTFAKGSGLSPYAAILKTVYCTQWYGLCTSIDLSSYSYVAIATGSKLGTYSENYASLGLEYMTRSGNWAGYLKASYGTGMSKANMASAVVNFDSLLDGELEVERTIYGNHGLALKYSYETLYAGLAGGSPAVTNTAQYAMLLYKYSW